MAKKATYKCKYCNKQVVFGEHFCEKAFYGQKKNKPKNESFRYPVQRIAIVAISLLLSISLLVAALGLLAFMPVLIAILMWVVILIVGKLRKEKGNQGYKKLLSLIHGDASLAERLISVEAKRFPKLSREECADRAYEKLYSEQTRHY